MSQACTGAAKVQAVAYFQVAVSVSEATRHNLSRRRREA